MLAASNPQDLWYLTRGFGLVSWVLLSASVVLGIVQISRLASPGLPRFVTAGLHRNVSLLAVLFLTVHVVTAIADPFAPISVVNSFVPFGGQYRPLWLGLGALATDLLLALVVTSLIRLRLGLRTWRAIHWAAYVCWPVALLHSLGTGTDTRAGWVQLIYLATGGAVLAAVAWRLFSHTPVLSAATRAGIASASGILAVLIVAWTLQGPLHPGWAKRSGTPTRLLGGTAEQSVSHR